ALGDWQLGDQYYDRMMGATALDVTEAVRRYLTPERAAWVMYRPTSAEPIAPDGDAALALLTSEPVAPLPPAPRIAEGAGTGRPRRLIAEREEAGVRVYRTAGGVPVLVRRRPEAPITHVGVYALGGAASEAPALGGLSTLLVRTSLKGTDRRSAAAIAEESEMLGAVLGTSATADGIGWTVSVPAARVASAVDLLANVVQQPTFPDDALDVERAVAISNVAQQRDDMYRYPVRLAVQAAYGSHPYARSVLGTEETLAAIEASAVRAWHRDRVLRSNAAIAVVGEGDPDELAALVAAYFGELEASATESLTPPTWPTAVEVLTESRDKAQTALVVAFQGPARRDDDRFAADLIAGVASGLGGRFFDELRDRQSLAYTVQAFASQRMHAGMFISYIATSPEREEVARRGLLAEFAKLRDADVFAEELDRAKRYAIGTRAIRQESGGSVLAEIVDAWLYGSGLAELEEHDDRVMAVTPAQMRAVADRYFVEERRVEGIVRGVPKTV
ncbi:MAG TPA: pitrilysin family protein, partial [Gemmatimonadaceae bacterium]|nr:pitrilysin family protein [Gemmatimonadaceae bacterium]